MLTWFRNRWPDPRIKEREEEMRTMVERHEASIKEWAKKFTELSDRHYRVVQSKPEVKEVPYPVYIDKIVEKVVYQDRTIYVNAEDLREENRVLNGKLKLALGRLHGWDHNQAISIEKMKARDV